MWRDLGRVHIASFAVGIVGLVVGIVGIVLAIVFGTAPSNCPATPTCPPVITQQACNSQLFSIRTGVVGITWNDSLNDLSNANTQLVINNITASLTQSLNTGLNSQSSLLRILAAGDAQSNNAAVQITRLEKNGTMVVAVGSGAISSAKPLQQIPAASDVGTVITKDNTTFVPATVDTSPQVCGNLTCAPTDCSTCYSTLAPTTSVATLATLPATQCPVCPPATQATCPPVTCPACPTTTAATCPPPATVATSGTCPPVPTCPACPTQTVCTTAQSAVTSSAAPVTSSTAPVTTTQGGVTGASSTTQGTPAPTSQSTQGTSSPSPSSTAPSTSQTTPGATSSSSTPVPSTQGSSSTAPQTSTTSSGPATSATTPGAATSSTGAPTSAQTTQGTSSPSTKTVTSTPSTAPPTSGSPSSPSSPSPTTFSTTPGSSVPTIGPNQCYYQSNIAIAFEFTDPYGELDGKIENFINNTLLFYPGNPYQFGKSDTSLTQLAMVPYPSPKDLDSLMSYGAAATQQQISTLFFNFGIFAGTEPDIFSAFNTISGLKYSGAPGVVIVIGNNGTSIADSLSSSQVIKEMGFTIITIGYNSPADFSSLASGPNMVFSIHQDTDELGVAQQIGTLLNNTFCSPGSSTTAQTMLPPLTSGAPQTSSTAPAPTTTQSTQGTPSTTPGATSTIQTSQGTSSPSVPSTFLTTKGVTSSSPVPSTSSVPSTTITTPVVISTSSITTQGPSIAPQTSKTSSGPATSATTQGAVSSSTGAPTTSQSTQGTPSTIQSTQGTSPVPSTTLTTQNIPSSSPIPTTQTTQGTSPVPSTTLTTQGTPSPSPSSSSTSGATSSTPIPTTQTSQGSSSIAPQTSSTSSGPATSVTTQGAVTSSTGAPSTSQTTQGSPSPVPTTTQTTQGSSPTTPGIPTTFGPNQCYYQSNIAIAFELTDPKGGIDQKIENFINSTLLFYPGNPYQFGKADTSLTQLALVPYPSPNGLGDLMRYGQAATPADINTLFFDFGIFAGTEPNIFDAFNTISGLKYSGAPGVVIVIGNNGTSIADSLSSSQVIKEMGFTIITVGYNSPADFSSLASGPNMVFSIHQNSDELGVAQQIGTLLNNTFCSPGSSTTAQTMLPPLTSGAPQTSSPAPVPSTSQSTQGTPTPGASTIQTSQGTQTSSPTPVTSTSLSTSPTPSTSSIAPQTSTTSSGPASSSTTQGAVSSSTGAPTSSLGTSSTPGATTSMGSTMSSQGVPSTSQTTPGATSTQGTSPVPTTTQGPPSTSQAPVTSTTVGSSVPTTTQGSSSSSPVPTTSQTTQGPSSSTSSQGTSTPVPTTTQGSSSSSQTTSQGASSSVSSSTISSSPAPITSTTAGTTMAPNQCFYQSNVAVAYELTTSNMVIDQKIENFINTNLLFYPGNPYQFGGKLDTGKTKLALVPYTPNAAYESLMVYGATSTQDQISTLFKTFEDAAGNDDDISEAFGVIGGLQYTGSPGFVILIGNTGDSIGWSSGSALTLQQAGFRIITIGYQSAADFSPLSSEQDFVFTINADADELTVAQQIGVILNTTYCSSLPTPSAAPITSSMAPGSSSSAPVTSSQAPVTSTSAPVASSSVASSSAAPVTSSAAPASSSTASGSSTTPAAASSSTTAPPTTSLPTRKYYSSNVAVAFELTDKDSALDLQIQSFIANDLFFYPGAPYQLGGRDDGKTALSLVPYPNEGTLADLEAYGATTTSAQITSAFEVFGMLAKEPASIADAFNAIPGLDRKGAPGFVILVGNNADSVAAAAASAATLTAQGFQIITIAFKTDGSFDSLGSQVSYNYKITSDADQVNVASQIGNLLNSTLWPAGSTTVGPTGSTMPSSTVTQGSSTMGSSSTTQSPASSSTMGSTVTQGSTVTGSGSSTTQAPISSSTMGSTVTQGSTVTVPGSSSTIASSTAASTTQSSGSSSSMGTTVTVPGSSSTMVSSTVTIPSTVASTTMSSTTSQICPNQQVVYQGQVGVIFELLPSTATTQQAVINDFVENMLLNSNFYGLALDNLTGDNRTLATAIPYPSTGKYNVQGYGSARSQADFKAQVDAFNGVIQPVTAAGDISDALLYITTVLPAPAGGAPSALIIVGNSGTLLDAKAPILADDLKNTFTIFTVSVGDNAVDLSALATGPDYAFTGNTQAIADQIAQKLESSNPAVYCPPPLPSTTAAITSTAPISTTMPVTTTVTSATTMTTARPTVGPCQCQGRFVYNGDLSIAFEFLNTDGSRNIVNFLNSTFLKNPDSYGLNKDVNGNQPSKLELLPYPETGTSYTVYGYGNIHSSDDINGFISAYQLVQPLVDSKDPDINVALEYIKNNPGPSAFQAVLIIGSDATDVPKAVATATALKAAGYLVITVAQTASADVFSPLASGNQYALQLGDNNGDDVAAQIASLLLDASFVCFDDGSNTAAPVTRCPTTQGTTLPGVSSTTGVPVASSSTMPPTTTGAGSSTTQAPASSSTMGSTVTSSGSSTTQAPGSSSTVGSTVTQGSTVTDAGSSITTQAPASSSTVGSTVTQGSTITDSGSSSTTQAPASSSTMGSTVTQGSTVTVPGSSSTIASSTVASTTQSSGSSSSMGTTVTVPGSSSTMASTATGSGSSTTQAPASSSTMGSTVTQGSTVTDSGSSSTTQAPASSSTVASTVTQGSTVTGSGSSTTQAPASSSTAPVVTSTVTGNPSTSAFSSTTATSTCATPYTGKLAVVYESKSTDIGVPDVDAFVRNTLFASTSYDFTKTLAINVPYPNTDSYDAGIFLAYGDAKSLADLQTNFDTLDNQKPFGSDTTISDGLIWLQNNRPNDGSKAVVVVVGYDPDDDTFNLNRSLAALRAQGYQVISVGVATGHADFSSIADKPEWYFQVDDTNGQSVADQISSILCHL